MLDQSIDSTGDSDTAVSASCSFSVSILIIYIFFRCRPAFLSLNFIFLLSLCLFHDPYCICVMVKHSLNETEDPEPPTKEMFTQTEEPSGRCVQCERMASETLILTNTLITKKEKITEQKHL